MPTDWDGNNVWSQGVTAWSRKCIPKLTESAKRLAVDGTRTYEPQVGLDVACIFHRTREQLKKLKEITEMMLELMTVHLLNAAYDRVMCLF